MLAHSEFDMIWSDDHSCKADEEGEMKTRVVNATEFKAKCLSLLDEVAAQDETITITKRGRRSDPPRKGPGNHPEAPGWAKYGLLAT